jgi:hypothetical protein
MTEHVPTAQTWACVQCGHQWPCQAAKTDLLSEYAEVPVALALYLASAFVECAHDLENKPAQELYRRFFGWLQFPPSTR